MAVKAKQTDTSRDRVLEAAQRLFAERGTEGVTMADIAGAAGVARATVFNQFGSKRALIEATTEGVFAGYQTILNNALADRTTPTPVLVRALFRVMGGGIEGDQRFYSAVFREVAKATVGLDEGGVVQRARMAAKGLLVQLLTRGQARRELASEFAPEDLAVAFDSLVFGTIAHWLYDDASESLTASMLRAADVFLGRVGLVSCSDYTGPPPVLTESGRRRKLAPVPLARAGKSS